MGIRQEWPAAVCGITAAGAAMGVAECLAAVTGARTQPLVAVGGAIIDGVPKPVKEFAIRTFGTNDKTALLIGTTVLLALAAAGIGLAALRRARVGDLGIAAFGLVGAVAAVTRPGAGALAAVPAVAGAGIAALVLRMLVRAVPRPAPVVDQPSAVDQSPAVDQPSAVDQSPAVDQPSAVDQSPAAGVADFAAGTPADAGGGRRRLLWMVVATAGAAGVAGAGGRWLGSLRNVAREREEVVLPVPASPAAALPRDVARDIPQITPFITSSSSFYRIDTALVVPQVSTHTWKLQIKGRVGRPLTLTWDQLLARPMIERYTTLTCVSNDVGGDLIGTARWLGVPVRDLLDEVGPEPGADQVVSRSVDGFTAGTPTAVLRDGRDAMLAIAMNGAPLPAEHGFPVRMVVPGLYGYVSATKWLVELEVTSFDAFDAYWVPRGWSQQAPIKTGSRIDTPRDGRTIHAGRVTVAGVAWAQHRGVEAVEVRVDDGPWQAATLAPVPSTDTWRQWLMPWDAHAGRHRLTVRATDGSGAVQTDERADPAPNGATGLHSVEITVT
jgi:DMSO/TMAO reductase YedYZ molybdopterin-dependent catalytic subunit